MKSGFTAPGDYIYFKSQVPLHKIPIGTKHWRYYDFGPKAVPPLVCLPGTAGTADVYYKQIMALSMKGYRVISVDIPRVWNHVDWIQAFEKFLDAIDVHHIHIYGTSLGGFLAQLYAQHRPRRVKSLVLSNTFLDTHSFSAAMPWAPVVSWAPSFLLKRYVLTGIRDGPHEPFIADSVDFVVSQVETLSKDDLASRLSLTVDNALVGPLLLSDTFITIMDTNDYCAVPQECKDEVGDRYPEARRAYLKTGGDFPFLSRPDEVNLHLQLHLRRVGVEARPDMVAGVSKNSSSGNSSEQDKREHTDKSPPKDDEGNSCGGPSKMEEQEDNDDLPEENNEEDDHLPKKDSSDDEDDDSGGGGSKNSEGPSKSNDQNEPEDSNKEGHGGSEGPSDGEEMNKNHENMSRGDNDGHSEECLKNEGKENGEHPPQPQDGEHRSIPLDEIVSTYMILKLKKYIIEQASLHMLRDLEKISAAMMFCEFARFYYLHLLYIGGCTFVAANLDNLCNVVK